MVTGRVLVIVRPTVIGPVAVIVRRMVIGREPATVPPLVTARVAAIARPMGTVRAVAIVRRMVIGREAVTVTPHAAIQAANRTGSTTDSGARTGRGREVPVTARTAPTEMVSATATVTGIAVAPVPAIVPGSAIGTVTAPAAGRRTGADSVNGTATAAGASGIATAIGPGYAMADTVAPATVTETETAGTTTAVSGEMIHVRRFAKDAASVTGRHATNRCRPRSSSAIRRVRRASPTVRCCPTISTHAASTVRCANSCGRWPAEWRSRYRYVWSPRAS